MEMQYCVLFLTLNVFQIYSVKPKQNEISGPVMTTMLSARINLFPLCLIFYYTDIAKGRSKTNINNTRVSL